MCEGLRRIEQHEAVTGLDAFSGAEEDVPTTNVCAAISRHMDYTTRAL